jgi:dephospho-CoA kinase
MVNGAVDAPPATRWLAVMLRRMERVLITGMSGVGKSTVAERLTALGFKAIDIDHEGFSRADERGDHHWDVGRVRQLMATEDADVLFVIGSDDAQVLFYPDFDHIVLLSAPRDVMLERLASRTNNRFGKSPDELAKILADLEEYEPMMRRSATHEIDTSRPLDHVIDEVLSLVQRPAR